MKGTIFSKRMALVYTMIVAIPLAVLIIAATEYLRAAEYRRIISSARSALENNAQQITNCIEIFYRIESSVGSNSEMINFFLFTDKQDTMPMLLQLRAISDEMERLQVSLPLLYGIRIFVTDDRIPERWPIFFHQDRLALPIGETWQFNYKSALMSTLEIGRNSAAAYSVDLLFSKNHVGYLQLLIRMTDFFPFLYREEDSVQQDYVFYKNEPVTDSESGITGLEPPLAERVLKAAGEESAGSISFREGRRQYLFVWHGIPNSDLLLVRDCSAEMIQESIIVIRIAAVIGILASIIILFLIIRFATQKMMGRLFVIMNGMREVRQGNLDINITVEGNDEISDMARMFINMVSRIRELIGGITREQQLVTQTEIKAMQNQINAHFLYNVLETIKMQAEVHNQDTIVQSITLLGKMLRYCLKLRLHRVALREELEYIRSYIALLNIRNDYTITVNEQIEDRYLDFEIPKMLIQPLVENAFLHAIEPLGENAVIDITVDADSARGIVWIGVSDHGQGLMPEALEKISASIFAEEAADRGIGLRNIQQRLTAFYGTSWKLRISSEYGKGTNILIPIPLE